MAVVLDLPALDDFSTSVAFSAATSATTPAKVITSAANRAGLLAIATGVIGTSGFSGSLGGVSGSLITGTESNVNSHVLFFKVVSPPSGSHSGTMSWTTISAGTLTFVTASGVDQTTPFNNGTKTSGSGVAPSLAVTSTSGDLTIDAVAQSTGTGFTVPTQTEKWNDTVFIGGSVGPGTGTTTHGWADPVSAWDQIGANFNQAAAVGGFPPVPEAGLLKDRLNTLLRM